MATLAEQVGPILTAADRQIADQLAELEELRNRPPQVVVPTAHRILVGACPTNGFNGRNAQALASVGAKLGVTASLRAFAEAADTVLVRPGQASRVHWSLTGLTLAQATNRTRVKAQLVNAQPGDEIEGGPHELDSKINKGQTTLEAGAAVKNALYDTVVALVADGELPDLTVVNTLTGWAGDPKNTLTKGDLMRYLIAVRAHRLGMDFDGVDVGAAAYPDFYDEVGSVAEALARNAGYSRGWKCPELGYPRAAAPNVRTWDPTGVKRAAAIEDNLLALERTGCTSAEWFDYKMTRDDRLVEGTPEIAVIRRYVDRAAA